MGNGKIFAIIFALLITCYIGGVLVNAFEGVMEAEKGPDKGARFNETVDALVQNAWTFMDFLPYSIILIGAAWILQMSGLLAPRREYY